jgi:hypothetical protein
MTTPYRFVPMTRLQALRVNSALTMGRDPDVVLSPRQVRLRGLAMAHPDAAWPVAAGTKDLGAALAAAEAFAATLAAP